MRPTAKRVTEQFDRLHKAGAEFGETNDCVVKMIAQVLRCSYSSAHDRCAAYGRQNGNGMWLSDWMKLLRDMGVELTLVDKSEIMAKYPGWTKVKNVTTHHPDRFHKAWDDGCRYILLCREHVAYVENGELHDWTRGTAHRVLSIYRINE